LSVEGKRWPLSSSASPEGTAPEPEAETVATVAALLVEPDKRSRVATACGARRGRGRNEGKEGGGGGGVVVVCGGGGWQRFEGLRAPALVLGVSDLSCELSELSCELRLELRCCAGSIAASEEANGAAALAAALAGAVAAAVAGALAGQVTGA